MKNEPYAAHAALNPRTGAASLAGKMIGIIWNVEPDPIPDAMKSTKNESKNPMKFPALLKKITDPAPKIITINT